MVIGASIVSRPDAFRADVRDAKQTLEEAGGVQVRGYRAPTFSIGRNSTWAHAILAEEGYRYSSSVYPLKHDLYTAARARRRLPSRPCPDLVEVPLTTVRLLGIDVPASGGGFFRLYPYPVSRWLLTRANRANRAPAIFYLHPWEIDPEQPRQYQAPFLARFRHYLNLGRTEARLRRLLRQFPLGAHGPALPRRPIRAVSVNHLMDGSPVSVAVRPFQAGDECRWDEFVHARADGSFFHLSGWKRVIERAFGHRTHYLIAERGAAVTGVLPLTHVKSLLFGSSLISNAFGVQGGPIAEDSDSLRRLEAEAVRLMDAISVPVLELRGFSATRADWPSKKDLYASFRRSIEPSVERNLKSVPRKQRAMIRKGIANNLRSEIDDDIDRLYCIYSESVHSLGTPVFSKSYFRILREEFHKLSDIVTVTFNGRAIASVLNFYFRDEVLPFYGGGRRAARALAANDFMYWEVMRMACERATVSLTLDAARSAPAHLRSSATGASSRRRSSINTAWRRATHCQI